MKLKRNCKLDSKVQKRVKTLLKLSNDKNYNENAVITSELNDEICRFLEKAAILSKENEIKKELPKGLSAKVGGLSLSIPEENNFLPFEKMLSERELKTKKSTDDWYKKYQGEFQRNKLGGGFEIIN